MFVKGKKIAAAMDRKLRKGVLTESNYTLVQAGSDCVDKVSTAVIASALLFPSRLLLLKYTFSLNLPSDKLLVHYCEWSVGWQSDSRFEHLQLRGLRWVQERNEDELHSDVLHPRPEAAHPAGRRFH